MKPLLVFDYDGTIHNTIEIYEEAFRSTFQWLVAEGVTYDEEIPTKKIESWLGMNSREMWKSFRPDMPEQIREKASLIIGRKMVELIKSGRAKWYDGAEETLDDLKQKGYRMVILSNCKKNYRDVNREVFGMDRWFEEFYDCESFEFRSKNEIMKEIMKTYEESPVVIGDRHTDVECSKAVGGASVGCCYGYGTVEELKDADICIGDIRELKCVL